MRSLISEMYSIVTDSDRYADHLTVFYQLSEMLKICKETTLNTLFTELKRQSNTEYKKM